MELRHLKLLQRWIWLLILIPILSTAAGYYFLQQQPTIYEAKTIIIIGPGIDSPNPDLDALRTGAQLMQTYAELPRTDAFQKRVIENLNLNMTTSDLDDLITIRPIVDTQLLHVIVQSEDPNLAVAIANAVGEELVALGPSNEQNDFLFERIGEQARSLESDILAIDSRIAANTEQLNIETDSINRALLIQQIADDERRLSEANNTLADLYSVLQEPLTNRIDIIDLAEEATALSSQTALTLLVTAVAGVVISAVLAFGLILLEDRVIDVENLGYLNDLPLWGVIKPGKATGNFPVKTAPDTPAAQQYYQLGAQILYRRDADSAYSVLFTSLTNPDYVPELASNLALAIANTQNSVFLMDVDFRRNEIANMFELSDVTRLTDIFRGELSDELKVADVVPSPHLKVLPSGDANTVDSFNMLASPKMLGLLRTIKQASKNHRLLMTISPPLAQMHDSLTLVSQFDMVILVVNNRKLSKTDLKEAIGKLEGVGAKVGGMIIIHE
jgi:capsular polysaccharide biosynthesis protein/Mrp family chromosome partitioning ATPase